MCVDAHVHAYGDRKQAVCVFLTCFSIWLADQEILRILLPPPFQCRVIDVCSASFLSVLGIQTLTLTHCAVDGLLSSLAQET